MRKKLLLIALTIVLLITLVSCGSKESEQKETTQKKENIEEEQTTDSDDELSQSEWMEKNGDSINIEDGYDIVDNINIKSSKTSLIFSRTEQSILEGGENVLLVYFDFSNIDAEEATLDSHYNFSAFQDGVKITRYATVWDDIESVENAGKSILSGATIEVAIVLEPSNWDSPIKLRVTNDLEDDGGTQLFFQQQEIALK